jgi:hypothetical protein
MSAQLDRGVHELVVTGPARDLLFARFARLYLGRSDVKVIKDRRAAERRRAPSSVAGERRRGQRRRGGGWLFPEPGAPAAGD